MFMENVKKLNLNRYLSPLNMTSQSNPTNGQARVNSNVIRMAEEKDKWDRKGVTTKYHRMTALKARKYVKSLRDGDSKELKVQLEKLEDDEHHIMKCRARLSKTPKTRQLQEKLKCSFNEWRNGVKDRNIRRPSDQREDHIKPIICTGSGNDTGNETGNNTTGMNDQDSPAHDMKAYFMFFEKDGPEWKGKTVHDQGFPKYESFPNQRIPVHQALYSGTHNPLKPTHDENGRPHLRYIHIPANHMGVSKDVATLVVCMC